MTPEQVESGARTVAHLAEYFEELKQAAAALIERGVEEGYLAPRSPEELDQILASGFGAFVEGRHLAGLGALLVDEENRVGEVASLYTLTRFLGEGIGGPLLE